jgi:hypothetical protein
MVISYKLLHLLPVSTLEALLMNKLINLSGATRTSGLNKLIMLTVAIDGLLSGSKKEKENNFCSPSLMVAQEGFER